MWHTFGQTFAVITISTHIAFSHCDTRFMESSHMYQNLPNVDHNFLNQSAICHSFVFQLFLSLQFRSCFLNCPQLLTKWFFSDPLQESLPPSLNSANSRNDENTVPASPPLLPPTLDESTWRGSHPRSIQVHFSLTRLLNDPLYSSQTQYQEWTQWPPQTRS